MDTSDPKGGAAVVTREDSETITFEAETKEEGFEKIQQLLDLGAIDPETAEKGKLHIALSDLPTQRELALEEFMKNPKPSMWIQYTLVTLPPSVFLKSGRHLQ
ncbi:MAG TPA: hypothetical protein VMV50_02670 [Candidatus Paceibacterota bacterium]|nr:hypothetical protein [Candidatus Paceibacterota bacterium]